MSIVLKMALFVGLPITAQAFMSLSAPKDADAFELSLSRPSSLSPCRRRRGFHAVAYTRAYDEPST